MTDIIRYIILGLMIFAVVKHYDRRSLAPCVVFVSSIVSHTIISLVLDLGDDGYYLSAALFAYFTIEYLGRLEDSIITPILEKIAYAMICTNAAGWVIWFSYIPPIAYDGFFLLIYGFSLIVILIKRDNNRHGNFAFYNWFADIRGHANTRMVTNQNKQAEA